MKYVFKTAILIIALGLYSEKIFAQEIEPQSDESYCKANVAITNFKILGVSTTKYARCAEAINFLEKSKRVRMVKIDGVEFVDNGEDNDLVADDGIMTSRVLFDYARDGGNVPIGQYVVTRDNSIVYDASFAHVSKINTGMTAGKISIACDVYWESCDSWPPAYQSLCRRFTWPFSGSIVIANCRITWTSN